VTAVWRSFNDQTEKRLMRIQAATAAEICTRFHMPRSARVLLRPEIAPAEFMDALLAHQEYEAGIEFLAHALPARYAVWWGCLCMQHACGEDLAPKDKDAAIAAIRWILEPTEQSRRTAMALADAAGPTSLAGTLARAASEVAGDPRSPIPNAFHVANAVHLASVKGDPAGMRRRQRSYMELGIGIANDKFI